MDCQNYRCGRQKNAKSKPKNFRHYCFDRKVKRSKVCPINHCYCKEPSIQPLVLLKPNSKSNFRLKAISCENSDEEKEENPKKTICPEDKIKHLTYTTQRKSYEYLRDDSSFESEIEIRDEKHESSDSEDEINLNELKQFRNEYFFETKNTKDLIRNVPSHICTYSFILDKRGLPVPENQDDYGLCRCTICGKIMQDKKTTPLISKMGDFVPRPLYMANENNNIKINVKLDKNYCGKVYKMDDPNPFNTFALAYQKMLI